MTPQPLWMQDVETVLEGFECPNQDAPMHTATGCNWCSGVVPYREAAKRLAAELERVTRERAVELARALAATHSEGRRREDVEALTLEISRALDGGVPLLYREDRAERRQIAESALAHLAALALRAVELEAALHEAHVILEVGNYYDSLLLRDLDAWAERTRALAAAPSEEER